MRVFLDRKVRATTTLVYVSVIGAIFVGIGAFLARSAGTAAPVFAGLFLAAFLVGGNFFLAGWMRVVVDEAAITCSVLLAKHSVALADVARYEIVELPLVTLQSRGFPGRSLADDRLFLRVGGRRGVELSLRDGRRVFVEHAPPEALAGALRDALAHRGAAAA